MARFTDPVNLAKHPFKVRRIGETTAICAFDDKAEAQADAADRNARAEKFGVASRYEFIEV